MGPSSSGYLAAGGLGLLSVDWPWPPRCRPSHRIGWLLVAIGLLLAVDSFAEKYARYSMLAEVNSTPAVQAMAWVSFWLDAPTLFLMLFIILLFPDGHLPSCRWRPVAWLMAIAAVAGAGVALRPGELPELAPIRNPFGVQGATPALELLEAGSLLVFANADVPLYAPTQTTEAWSITLRFLRDHLGPREAA